MPPASPYTMWTTTRAMAWASVKMSSLRSVTSFYKAIYENQVEDPDEYEHILKPVQSHGTSVVVGCAQRP